MFYIPIAGGQETYIANLHKLFKSHNLDCDVIQPGRFLENYKDVKKIFYIPKLRKFTIPDLDWFQFNLGLSLSHHLLKSYDTLICHYPFHYPALKWHSRVIVLSHGVDWKVPAKTVGDRFRISALETCKRHQPIIVANDTHFLRTLGVNISPATYEFQQVGPKVWYIPNCVDTGYFKPLDTLRKNMILVPRNVRPERGVHLAIQAFSQFLKKYEDYEMWIVGQTGGQYFQYCTALIRDYKIERHVKFLGSQPWESLVNYYNQAQLTLIPTVELEGTSLSALESMACGTPVVSTDVAGLKDLPTIKASPQPLAIYDAMDQVMQNWDVYAQQQLQIVRHTFNLDNWHHAWLQVIQP